jgi:superfamily I DNA/RNA helicase
LEKWRVFLHPSQRRYVEMNANGPVRVLGGAGTGKSVVAMHRAKHLVEKVFEGENQRLLFTTFTRNLAADIEENLAMICSEEVMGRIEVVNLDRWVSEFLRKQGYDYEIDYGQRTDALWDDAMTLAPEGVDLPRRFYREEWEQIIQPHEVLELRDYLRVARTGRGTRLSRGQRKAIWPVFEEYLALLNEKRLREPDGAMRDVRLLLEGKGPILPYRSIVVDEAQDLGRQAFLLLRAMVPEQPHDLFLVGDAHQRIYRHPIVLSQCGVDIVGRGRRLRINYRTTEENRRWAVGLLEGVPFDDLDGGVDTQKGYRSLLHGVDPEVRHFESFADEVKFLGSYLEALDAQGLRRTCLVARTNQLVDGYEGALKARGIPTYPISRNRAEDRSVEGVRLATMHRVKGLEFERVLIAGVNGGVVPLDRALEGAASEHDREMLETKERSLLYVAATRARREVVVTSYGEASPFL